MFELCQPFTATYIAKPLKPKLKPKLGKECVFANADRPPQRNTERTTMAIRNAGLSADIKVITLNELTAKRKVKCLENPHYA